MAEPPCPWDLSWADVDPMLHAFDPATVEAVVAGLPPAAEVPPRPAVKRSSTALQDWGFAVARPWADRMSGALVDRYGRWASGWRWSQSDGDWPGGGPVGAWCCPRDSVTTLDETLARVAGSLRQWRGWLDELLALFLDELPPGERAYARLIRSVLERSAAYGEWHLVARTALRWQREAGGLPAADVDAAVGGRFRDWLPPDEGVVDDVARRIARAETDVS